MILEKEPNSRNPQTAPVSVNDGHDRPEIKQQNPVLRTAYPTDGGSASNLHPIRENSGNIATNPNPKVDSLRIRKYAPKLLSLVHQCSQEFLKNKIDDLDLLSLRFYANDVYGKDRHGQYQKEKPEEEEKTSMNENSKKTKASKDSQLNYGYMSGTVGTLNSMFLAPSDKPSQAEIRNRKIAEERNRKILKNCPANVVGCVHEDKGGCLTAFVEAELSKLQSKKKEKTTRPNRNPVQEPLAKAEKCDPKWRACAS